MAINIIITDAGRAALVNNSNNGTSAIVLSHVAFGTGQSTSTADQTALQSEFMRLNTVSGEVVAVDTLHVTINDDSSSAYGFSEFGLFTDAGVLFAVYSQSSNIMYKTGVASLRLAIDLVFASLDVSSITFGSTNFLTPPATTTKTGVAKIAYQSDIDTGTDNTKIVTPLRLKQRVDQLLDGVTSSLNTFKKIATALSNKLGKSETAVNSSKLSSYSLTDAPTADTVVRRNASADIKARLFHSNFPTQTSTPSSSTQVAIRNSTSDGFVRFVSLNAFLNYLGGSKVSTQAWGKLGGNLIIQCGYFGTANNAINNFRIAFPTVCIAVVATPTTGSNSMAGIYTHSITRTGFAKVTALDEGNPTSFGGRYIAIGY